MTLKKRNEIALNQVSKPAMSAITIDKDHCKNPNMKKCEINPQLNEKETEMGAFFSAFSLKYTVRQLFDNCKVRSSLKKKMCLVSGLYENIETEF